MVHSKVRVLIYGTIWIWLLSMKDYLKTLCQNRGIARSRFEQIANVERPLSIAADIANRAKHGVLRQSRSGDFAKLQNVRISIPLTSLASIAFDKPAVRITVDIPNDSELTITAMTAFVTCRNNLMEQTHVQLGSASWTLQTTSTS